MKFKNYIFFLLIGMLLVACTKEITLKEYMVGSWQTKYINLKMPTYQKSDSTFVMEDDFSKPNVTLAQSVYNNDGTFTAWYLNPKGVKEQVTTGNWEVKKDSLYITFEMNDIVTEAKYYIEKTEDGFLGKSADDWDKDGEKDDFLLMKTKRIELPKEE